MAAKQKAKRHAYIVGASFYGGPSDKTVNNSDPVGSSGTNLTGKSSFAELGMGHDLGGLPYGTKLILTYRESGETDRHTITVEKLDIGAGGAPVSGHARRIDIWYDAAKQLGDFTKKGTALVKIERVDGKPIAGPHDENTSKYGLGKTTVGAGILGTGLGPQTEEEGNEASEKAKSAIEHAGGFLGELSLEKIFKLLIALGLGAFALKVLTNAKIPIPV
jgi:hypothetical protein